MKVLGKCFYASLLIVDIKLFPDHSVQVAAYLGYHFCAMGFDLIIKNGMIVSHTSFV